VYRGNYRVIIKFNPFIQPIKELPLLPSKETNTSQILDFSMLDTKIHKAKFREPLKLFTKE